MTAFRPGDRYADGDDASEGRPMFHGRQQVHHEPARDGEHGRLSEDRPQRKPEGVEHRGGQGRHRHEERLRDDAAAGRRADAAAGPQVDEHVGPDDAGVEDEDRDRHAQAVRPRPAMPERRDAVGHGTALSETCRAHRLSAVSDRASRARASRSPARDAPHGSMASRRCGTATRRGARGQELPCLSTFGIVSPVERARAKYVPCSFVP